MKNAMAVVCSLLLPLNLTPQIAFAALPTTPTKSDPDILVRNDVQYMKIEVAGEQEYYYCETKVCRDLETLQKKGSAPLYFNFDKSGKPTMSDYRVKYDPATKSRIVNKLTKPDPAILVRNDVQYMKIDVEGEKGAFYCETKVCKDLDTLQKKGSAPLYSSFDKTGKPTTSAYSVKYDPETKSRKTSKTPAGKDKAVADIAGKTGTSSEKTDTEKTAPPSRAKTDTKGKSGPSLEELCAIREAMPLPGERESALQQLQAAKEGDMGISSDGQSVSADSSSDKLAAECAELKKQKALADASKPNIATTGVGPAAAPPAANATTAPEPAKEKVTMGKLIPENWGGYLGTMAGGAVLFAIGAAIMGGPVGVAAAAGVAVALVGFALYDNRNEIGQAVSTAALAIMDFFKRG
jgi:hypothetical protein